MTDRSDAGRTTIRPTGDGRSGLPGGGSTRVRLARPGRDRRATALLLEEEAWADGS